MAGKSAKFETDFLKMVFNGVPITNIDSSGGSTSLWIALQTADPGDLGSTANEGGYTAYTRVQTDRSTGASGWSVTSGTSNVVATVSPVSTISFPKELTTSTGTFGWFSVYPSSSAAGSSALYSGTIAPTIDFGLNITPQLTSGSSITED
jgi:hypothetical protein